MPPLFKHFCFLISALCFLPCLSHAQGFMPPMTSSTATVASAAARGPLQIGEEIPQSLKVTEADGQKRPLLSYKSYLEVLVIVFVSGHCEAEKSHWLLLKRLHTRYHDWRVSFVAVNTSEPAMLPELASTLKDQKLPWALVQDNDRAAATLLNITGTPEVLVTDESGALEYRGPIDGAPAALDAVIGHVDPVAKPEPPMKDACAL